MIIKVAWGVLALALISAIINVLLSIGFIAKQREVQLQAGLIQRGMANQQFAMALLNNLSAYAQEDPKIVPAVLEKYGIGINPNATPGGATTPR
ncbi:MAG: hypothetical protein SFY92_05905 [Verrucomicrobiae bacterium]|nr:hypothetical protein [Verrucomicrobiae bacterium]